MIKVSKATDTIDGSLFPQTTTTYRCSNKSCQDEIDKQTKKRLQIIKEKEQQDIEKQNLKDANKSLLRNIIFNKKIE